MLLFIGISTAGSNKCASESFDFDLELANINFAEFKMKSNDVSTNYSITSTLESKGILGFFTRLSVNSGVVGKVFSETSYQPKEAISKWKNFAKKGKSIIRYKDNRIDYVEYSPLKNERAKFFVEPTKQYYTIDPLTMTYLLLKKRTSVELCKGAYSVSDGRNLMKVSFSESTVNNRTAKCFGSINWIKGFDPKKYQDNDFQIVIEYSKVDNYFIVKEATMETRMGEVTAVRK